MPRSGVVGDAAAADRSSQGSSQGAPIRRQTPARSQREHSTGRIEAAQASIGEREDEMTETRRTSSEEARRVGDAIGVDWSRFDLEQFRAGMDVEFEHGSQDPQTNVTDDDPIVTGKIALAHMKEFPDYYERLEKMEAEAERYWAEQESGE
jgi:hypothetical protein